MAPQEKVKKQVHEKVEEALKPSFWTRSSKKTGQPPVDEVASTLHASPCDGNNIQNKKPSSKEKEQIKVNDEGCKSQYRKGNTLPYVELFLPDGRLVRQC